MTRQPTQIGYGAHKPCGGEITNSNIRFYGFIRAIVRNADGSVFSDHDYHNSETNFLLNTVSAWLSGKSTTTSVPPPTQIGAGNGYGTVSPTDTALWSPISGTQRACDSISTALGYSAQYNLEYGASGTDPLGAYTEVGLFDNAGNMWAHAAINEYLASGQTLTIQWMISMVADSTNQSATITNYMCATVAAWLAGTQTTTSNPPPTLMQLGLGSGTVASSDTALWTPTASITNLVRNSGFEVVTTTATVFSDALTSYTGSTVPAPWTLQSGSFTFGASGATSGASGSVMTAGNAQWKPVLGTDGTTKLALTAQATFTTPATVPTYDGLVYLWTDSNNHYHAYLTNTSFYIEKKVNGTYTKFSSVAVTPTASTAYTITLSLDNTGLLTAKLYQGTNTSGTLLQTLTATDTSLSGGFLIGVGGDTGVVISNASVTAPWANSWTIGGDSRVAWGLTQSAIGGKYSVSAVGVVNVKGTVKQNTPNLSASTVYTPSAYMQTTNVGSSYGAYIELDFNQTSGAYISGIQNKVIGTTSSQRVSLTGTSPSNTGQGNIILTMYDTGTVTFDNIQLEQGSTASMYVENDSTSSSATYNAQRRCDYITVNSQNAVQYSYTYRDTTDPTGNFTEVGLFDVNNNLWLHATLTGANKTSGNVLSVLAQIGVNGD